MGDVDRTNPQLCLAKDYEHLKHSHDIEALLLAVREKYGTKKNSCHPVAVKIEVGYSVGSYSLVGPNDFCAWIELDQSNTEHPEYPFMGFNRTTLHRALKAHLFYPNPVLEGDAQYD